MAAASNLIHMYNQAVTRAKSVAGRIRLQLQQHVGSSQVRVVRDTGLAILVAAANSVAINVASEPESRSPDAVAYLLGGAIGAVLLARRHWPLGVLIASAILLFLYYSLNYPGIPPAVALSVALYTTVADGHLRWGLFISAFYILAGLFVVVIRKHEPPLLMLVEMAQQAALLAVLILLGEVVRNRRRYLEEVRKRLGEVEEAQVREAARRVAEERLRIARELHDVLAHTVTAMSVQAGLALDALDDSPEQARTALGTIRTASREAMVEIRAAIGVLREGDDGSPARAPAPGLAQVDALVAEMEQAGLHVAIEGTGDRPPLSAALDSAAYRIIRESLTNTIRHAHATLATICIRYEPIGICIEVADNGTGANAYAGIDSREPARQREHGGHGLIGMSERAIALGGRLTAGPGPSGGFVVRAWLPTVADVAEGAAP